MVYTTRYSGGKGGRNAFEAQLRRLGVVQKNSRPNHPTTCGKAERFQQTMKKWLAAQPVQPTTIAQLQTLLDAFAATYNHRRPHRSLPQRATPATVYAARPKATPAASRDADTHDRIRRDRVDATGVVTLRHAGRLHHIGIGRTHARTHVLLLVQDLHIRIVNAATGELLRELILDPTRDYQPTGAPKGPTRAYKNEQARTRVVGSGCHSYVLRDHRARAAVWSLRTSERHLSRHRKGVSQDIGRSGRQRRGMSKARLVITAVVVEGRTPGRGRPAPTGCPQGWVSKLLARYRAEGEAAFEPRSRRPKTSPTATAGRHGRADRAAAQGAAEAGLDAGPDTIGWHLAHHHGITVSPATVARYLTRRRAGRPGAEKRPRPPTSGSQPSCRTSAGSPTSPTTG